MSRARFPIAGDFSAAKIILLMLATTSAGRALAADLPFDKGPPPPAATPAFTWTGFYVGVNGGAGLDHMGESYSFVSTRSFNTTGLFEIGPAFGGQIGYNYQFTNAPLFGNHLVLGGEVFADWSDITGSTTVPTMLGAATYGTHVRSFGAALGRLGYAFDRAFLYFQGGLPYAVTQSSYNVGPYSGSSSIARFEFGKQVAVGVGAEYALDDHWSLRADYLYSYVHAGWVYFNPAPNVNVFFTSRTSFHTGRVGLDYHFDLFAPPTPVIAKF